MSRIWQELSAVLHPSDQPPPKTWADCYSTKFALAQVLKPQTIFEIGVRTGYSAWTFLRAVPNARYLGIDSNSDEHGGFRDAIKHARRLLAAYDTTILEMSSQEYSASDEVGKLSGFDLIHIDGDHSFEGCLFDLQLAKQIGFRHLLVDDFAGIADVRRACQEFADRQSCRLTQLVIDDGHNGSVLFTHY